MKIYDFTGGYNSNLPPELTDSNTLLSGTNLYWKGKLQKRPGWAFYVDGSGTPIGQYGIEGFCRAYINSTWQNIVAAKAIPDSDQVCFYRGDTGTYTKITHVYDPINKQAVSIGTSVLWEMSSGFDVEMIFVPELNVVIAVNGGDEPKIIQYIDNQYCICDLREFDIREWSTDLWFAGQYDASADTFTDDTDAAQDETADDFQIFSTDNDDGFYIASVNPFNAISIIDFNPSDAASDILIEYYAGNDIWTEIGSIDYSRFETNHSGGNTLESATQVDILIHFNINILSFEDGDGGWTIYGDISSQIDPDGVSGGLLNKYVIRITAGTAPSAASSCTQIKIYNTQYLTQLFQTATAQAVCLHKDRLYLGAENVFRFSPANQVTGWYAYDLEICAEGGLEILQMVSCNDYIAIIKAAAIYTYTGTTTSNFVLERINALGGVSKRGACFLGGGMAYVAKDGLRFFASGNSYRVSRHIQSDYDALTKTNACMIDWDGNALIMFPTDGIMYWIDPDTFDASDNEAGEGKVAVWKWTGKQSEIGVFANGDGDNGYLILFDLDNTEFYRSSSSPYDYDGESNIEIPITFQTKYVSEAEPAKRKIGKRFIIDISKSGDWTCTVYVDNGDRSASLVIASGTGSTHYITDIALPYILDGYNMSVKIENSTLNTVEIFGITTDTYGRGL